MPRHHKSPIVCLQCQIVYKYKKTEKGKFCTNACQQKYIFNIKYDAWLAGDGSVFKGRSSLRRAVIHRDGNRCSECGITEWRGKPIILEVEHKDGNSADNRPENLCLLCPNCHSQTFTYCKKNLGKGRTVLKNKLLMKEKLDTNNSAS